MQNRTTSAMERTLGSAHSQGLSLGASLSSGNATLEHATSLVCSGLSAALGGSLPGGLEILSREAGIESQLGRRLIGLTRVLLGRLNHTMADRDAMVHEAERRRQELSEADWRILELNDRLDACSRAAAMSGVATGVLHSVSNVLKSVDSPAAVTNDSPRPGESTTVRRLASLLDEHRSDLAGFFSEDVHAEHRLELLAGLATRLTQDRSELLHQIDVLRRSIDNIKAIVAMQQSYAHASDAEFVSLSVVVDDALKISDRMFEGDGTEVEVSVPSLRPIFTDRDELLHLLVNLLKNARESVHDTPGPNGRVRVRAYRTDETSVRIEVSDDGVGIPEDRLGRLFEPGFTTKESGRGYGLHLCALAAVDLGGSITAHSHGPGQGATFRLDLPFSTEDGEG